MARALNGTEYERDAIAGRFTLELRAALSGLDEAGLAELTRYAAYLRWRKDFPNG